jgi:hypothetical protein
MTPLLLALVFVRPALPLEGEEPGGAPGVSRPAIVLKTASAGPVTVHYLTVPWGPNTFAEMERGGGESYYAGRTWPFARLLAKAPFAFEGTALPAGNYALVFHPNTADNQGMSLEVRRIAVPEFLVPGNVMTKAPAGEAVRKDKAVFETQPEVAGSLCIEMQGAPKGPAQLVVRYGDRKLVRDLTL